MPRTARFTADRRGFTLVEVLIVIGIIGTLVALLLPAVNSAREAGRRTACTNNQFQQAFATIRFNDAKRFIPGWRNPLTSTGGTLFVSWPVMILPNMERKDIFNAITTNSLPSPAPYLSFFTCPSNPPDSLVGPALTYVGNGGVGSNSINGRASGVMLDLTATGTMLARVAIDEIASNDGTATTLLLAEESGRAITTSGSWNVQPLLSNGIVDWSQPPPAAVLPIPVFGIRNELMPTRVINDTSFDVTRPSAANMPSSLHPGGAVVAFCDGHTGFLKDFLQSQVYAQLLSWNHDKARGTVPYATWTRVGTSDEYAVLREGDYK